MNISNLTYINSGVTRINELDILRDFCTQIDNKITLFIILIFVGYFLKSIILPRARKGFKTDIFDSIFDVAESISETLMIGGCIVLYLFAWVQNILSLTSKVVGISMVSIMLLLFIIETIDKYKNKKSRDEVIKNIKANIEKLKHEDGK